MTDARILIVEDEEALRLDLVDLLQGEGYDVLDRGDGGEAIAAIELYRPRLVVCDVQLPSLGGIGILDQGGGRYQVCVGAFGRHPAEAREKGEIAVGRIL